MFILIPLKEIKENYSKYKGKYVCTEGYYCDGILFYAKDKKDEGGMLINASFHRAIDHFLKKMRKRDFEGRMRIIGKPGTGMTVAYNIGNFLKVELLDDKGNIIESMKVIESSIPKKLRGKI